MTKDFTIHTSKAVVEVDRYNKIKHLEHAVGFETEILLPEGLPAEKVTMIQTKNTRKTDTNLERKIGNSWQQNKQLNMFDGNRARYEGVCFDGIKRDLKIFYSHEKYRTYFYTADADLPRPYQAELLSINGVVITRDSSIPLGLRTRETNQNGIWHVVPAGYIDIESPNCAAEEDISALKNVWRSETPYAATERELHEELSIPRECVDVSRMRVVGILFNYNRNYDTTICVMVPVNCHSSEIALKGEEHESIRFLKTSLDDLKEELIQLSKDPSTSSGHLRGDIALTIAHLYGYPEFVKTLENIHKETSKSSL